ncbi:MAG: aspartate carbamoyltransferase catalytic subunit [Porticoccaceae bacterium]
MARNLLTLTEFTAGEVMALLDEAQAFRDRAVFPNLSGKIACNLFFESSTRTQNSFCIAEEKMGMRVVSFHPESSSMKKDESFYDTVKTFDSFGVDALVIRHPDNEYYNQLRGHIMAPILNGGDGTGNHPTQSLLDLMTIRQEFGGFAGLKVAIIGDIRHSRVAHTNLEIMQRLGMKVVVSGPEEFMSPEFDTEELENAVSTSDVVMMLRIQYERHNIQDRFTREQYRAGYGLTAKRAAAMKKSAIIMHPAPVNRNVEIDDEVVECPKSRIFRQMENGVYVRMAALRRAAEG